MIHMTELWLPIFLSALFVVVVSCLICMITPLHKGDFKKMPGEEKILAEMRAQGLQPGSYRFPMWQSMKDMGSPEMTAKEKLGPVGIAMVIPNGGQNMGMTLLFWFLYCLLVGAITSLAAGPVLPHGAPFKSVFHVTGLAALLGYAMGAISESIWKGQKWSITLKFVFDGVVYGVITGLTFAWLWPN